MMTPGKTRKAVRFSRPCYDKFWRCPGWSGGGTRHAKVSRCRGGSLAGNPELFSRRLWKWRLNRCPRCGVIILPYMVRWLDWRWYGWLLPRR
jgi:hypothetical protein